MEINDKNIETYIIKAKNGDQSAFRFLLNFFWSDVYNYQLKRTKSENDTEDITIQTFSKAFDKINTFDDKYVFKTWLITISKNIHIDLLRKKNNSIAIETSKEQEEKVYLVIDENPTPEERAQKNIEDDMYSRAQRLGQHGPTTAGRSAQGIHYERVSRGKDVYSGETHADYAARVERNLRTKI